LAWCHHGLDTLERLTCKNSVVKDIQRRMKRATPAEARDASIFRPDIGTPMTPWDEPRVLNPIFKGLGFGFPGQFAAQKFRVYVSFLVGYG